MHESRVMFTVFSLAKHISYESAYLFVNLVAYTSTSVVVNPPLRQTIAMNMVVSEMVQVDEKEKNVLLTVSSIQHLYEPICFSYCTITR